MNENLSQRYFSYMLRLWRDEVNPTWRTSIEDPHTGERKFFPDLEALCNYVQNQLTEVKLEEKSDYSKERNI